MTVMALSLAAFLAPGFAPSHSMTAARDHVACTTSSHSFPPHLQTSLRKDEKPPLMCAPSIQPTPDSKCYLIEGVESDGRDLVVCTPQAQEFAWFHGIRVEQLLEIDTESYLEDKSVTCELEVSYNGEDEWYCR